MNNFKTYVAYGALSVLGAAAFVWAMRHKSGDRQKPKNSDLSLLLDLMDQMMNEYAPVVKYFREMYRKLKTQSIFGVSPEAKQNLAKQLTNQMRDALAGVEEEVCRMKKIDSVTLVELFDKYATHKEVLERKKNINAFVNVKAKPVQNIAIKLPSGMVPDGFLKIYRRVQAMIRHNYYIESKKYGSRIGESPAKSELNGGSQDKTHERFRKQVCEKYGVFARNGESYTHLMRMSSYVFMCKAGFEELYENQKAISDRLALALMQGSPLPFMEIDPMSLDEDALGVFC